MGKGSPFFADLQLSSLQLDVITYNANIISACQKDEQWAKALQLFGDMQDADWKPNIITYSAAISACKRVGNGHGLCGFLVMFRNQACN